MELPVIPNVNVAHSQKKMLIISMRLCPANLEKPYHIPSSKQGIFFTLPYRTWLASNMESSPFNGPNWALMFSITTWWLYLGEKQGV